MTFLWKPSRKGLKKINNSNNVETPAKLLILSKHFFPAKLFPKKALLKHKSNEVKKYSFSPCNNFYWHSWIKVEQFGSSTKGHGHFSGHDRFVCLRCNFILICYNILKRGNRHSNSIMKELRKLMGLPRATSENVHVINLS